MIREELAEEVEDVVDFALGTLEGRRVDREVAAADDVAVIDVVVVTVDLDDGEEKVVLVDPAEESPLLSNKLTRFKITPF